jgi:flagellar protein FlgJ
LEVTALSDVFLNDYRLTSSRNGNVMGKEGADFLSVLEKTKSKSGDNQIDKTDKLYELCLELETFLIKNLLSSMRNTVQKSNLIDQGFAGKMYEDMLYEEYAKNFAKNAGFGLAEQAYRQLKTSDILT